jgi:hypothetical protein
MHRISSVLLAAALVGCSHISDLTQPKRVLTDREGDTRYEIVSGCRILSRTMRPR